MAATIWPATGRLITESEPLVRVLAYDHIAVAVTDVDASRSFYEKIGFAATGTSALVNASGMKLFLLQADHRLEDNRNALMDFPEHKYPGHTHACFAVPSVPAARAYLEKEQGIEITGERTMKGVVRAVFVRDPDRTTLEFERNVGEMEQVDAFVPEMIGDARPIDHVGTRVRDPEQRWRWYAEKLGFVQEVLKYDLSPDPLENFRPFIARTEAGCDINLLPNCNQPRAGRGVPGNRLIEGGKLLPGILFAALSVPNIDAAAEALRSAGVPVLGDADLEAEWGLGRDKLPPAERRSFFITDPDGNIFRLVQGEGLTAGNGTP